MMKKIISIIFLACLLLSCSNKKEKALENCSDSIFVQSYPEDILKDDRAYQILEKEKEELNKSRKIYWNDLQKHKKEKGYSSDLKLSKLIKKWSRDKTDENWKELKIYQKEIGYDNDEERIRLTNIWYSSERELDKKYIELKEYKAVKSKKIFKIVKFDNKISINNYYKIYKECETELAKTPTAFLKKWVK